jgi:iron complex outermembrane recepter protein
MTMTAAVASFSRISGSFTRLALCAAVLAASQAQAQGLEEIVVTAQKREQSLQDAPIAITAFGEAELEQKGIRDLVDIGTYVPNVKVAPLPSNTAKATVAIRGSVTSNPAIYWEPTVGIYLDGAYIGKFSGNVFKLAEVERIEVLRGPQGTLFGRNTSGGALNVITQKPTGEFGGKLRAGVGNYGHGELAGTLDLPAFDLGNAGSLSTRLSLSTEERDGFYDNESYDPTATISHPFTGQPVFPNARGSSDEHNSAESTIGRVDLLWEMTDRLSARYSVDIVDVENTPAKPQFTNLNTSSLTFGFPMPAELAQFLTSENDNVKSNSIDGDTFEEFDSTSQTLTVDYELCPNDILGEASLKYIANIRDLDFAQSLDNDGTPYGLFHSAIDEEYTQQSHEVQLTGSHERVNYVVGVYYFEEEADAYNPLQPLNSFFGPLLNRNAYGLESEQIAVYGQADWRPPVLDDRLTITLGVRWTDEEKEVYISHPDDPVPFAGQNDDSFTNTSPTVIFSYELADELNVYAKYAQGWKSGGFNGEAGSIESFNRGFGPEEIDSWEAGFKSRWLDNTLQVNGAVFYNDETDIQLSVFVPSGALPISVIENAGQSEKKGFELEVVYMPTADLQFMLNYGYLDSEFKEFLEFDPATGGTINVADQRFTQYTPEHTFNAGVEYTMLRASYGELTARLDYSYNDDYTPYVTPAQKAVSDIDGYGVLNGRLTLADIPAGDNKLQLALWGKNLLDEEYRLNTVPFGPFAVSFFGNPRTYGLDATYSF